MIALPTTACVENDTIDYSVIGQSNHLGDLAFAGNVNIAAVQLGGAATIKQDAFPDIGVALGDGKIVHDSQPEVFDGHFVPGSDQISRVCIDVYYQCGSVCNTSAVLTFAIIDKLLVTVCIAQVEANAALGPVTIGTTIVGGGYARVTHDLTVTVVDQTLADAVDKTVDFAIVRERNIGVAKDGTLPYPVVIGQIHDVAIAVNVKPTAVHPIPPRIRDSFPGIIFLILYRKTQNLDVAGWSFDILQFDVAT